MVGAGAPGYTKPGRCNRGLRTLASEWKPGKGRPSWATTLLQRGDGVVTQKAERTPSAEPHLGAVRSPAMRLIIISTASLYFELLLIRWLPTQIRVLAYFNNVILISCILGLGLGALLST